MEQCCGTCKWHWYENVDEGFVCTNIDSEYCADWTDYADSCGDWDLCCSLQKRRLCYEDEEACEAWNRRENGGRKSDRSN